MRTRLIIAGIAVALTAGCSTPLRQPRATFDRVTQEMKDASASGKGAGTADSINQAMMPPLDMGAGTAPEPNTASTSPSMARPRHRSSWPSFPVPASSMLVPPEVTGVMTLNLKNVTVREARNDPRSLRL